MTSWAANLFRRDRQWLLWLTVQGIGDGAGLWRFSTQIGWGLSDGVWKPYLTGLPDILSEVIDWYRGGAVESSAGLEAAILDWTEELTQLLAPDYGASTALSADESASSTVWAVDIMPPEFSTGALVNRDILWVGSEAVRIVSRSASPPTITVERAQLGTAAVPHLAGSEVYVRPRLLESREVRCYLAPLDGASDADARLVGIYTLSDLALDDTGTSWQLGCDAREQYLARRLPRAPIEARVTASDEDTELLRVAFEPLLPMRSGQTTAAIGTDDGEVIQLEARSRGGLWSSTLGERAYSGSEQDSLPEVGDRLSVLLSVANGDFVVDGSAVDTMVEVLLCLTLSPAVETLSSNYNPSPSGSGDWSGRDFAQLPTGHGAGVPWDELDWPSWQKVAAGPANYRVPHFVLRPGSTYSEVAAQLLEVAGVFLARSKGLLRLVSPELPLADESPAWTIDPDVALVREGEDPLPALTPSRTTVQAVEIQLELGQAGFERVVGLGDLPRDWDPLDLYDVQGPSLSVAAPGVDPDSTAWRDLSVRMLRRAWLQYTALEAELDAALLEMPLGDTAAVNLPGVPDFRGRRGLTGVGTLVELEVAARDDGVWVEALLYVQPTARIGRIAPSAVVDVVTGSSCTTLANVYTATDAPAGLPTDDALGFTVGDVVRLVDRAGADVGGGTETVTAVSAGSLSLSGDWGGLLASGLVIVFAAASEAVAQQTNAFVFLDRGWVWG